MFKPLEFDKENLLKSYSVKSVDKPVVLFGGRLTTQKGVDTLIKAARIYSQESKGPVTLIAGDGDLRGQLEQLRDKLKIESIYFIGHQNHQQMVKLFNIADVVAVPSKFEAFGLIAIEALACGTPVIASNVEGLSQTVNEQIGYLIEPGDHKTLAEKITAFIKERFKDKVRNKASAYIRENFSWSTTVSNVEKVYIGVLGRST